MKRTLGEVIKSLRLEKNLSQEQFAKIFKIATSTVGMWENNNRTPNEEMKEAIADYFNVDMNYLYGYTPIRNSYREGKYFQEHDKNIASKLSLWFKEVGTVDFTDDEVNELINFAKYLISKR